MRRTELFEIERKFLVKDLPEDATSAEPKHIRQGYLAVEPDREVRIRAIDSKYFLTVKTGRGLSRGEVETEITRIQFMGLWPLTSGRRIEKARYEAWIGEHMVEFDVYEGELDGLLIAEVEFRSALESQRFSPPEFLGDDVTEDDRYKNRRLAMEGWPSQAKLVARQVEGD